MSTVAIARGLSIAELQATYVASRPPVLAMDHSGDSAVRRTGHEAGGRVIAVIAAHSGAGASTLTVAVAQALSTSGAPVRILEVATAPTSGLAAATDAELGSDGSGWRRGRRGAVTIDRLDHRARSIATVAAPRDSAGYDAGVSTETLLVDLGRSTPEVFAAGGWLASALSSSVAVLVFRPTVPGLRQTEHLLAEVADRMRAPVILAAVGPSRWPRPVAGSAGPLLRAVRAAGRLVSVPWDRNLEVAGVTADPLPKQVIAAATSVSVALDAASPLRRPGESEQGGPVGHARRMWRRLT